MLKVLSIFGTRPEAIKMAPVIQQLSRHPNEIHSLVCVTAQHRQMLDQVLELFQLSPRYDLNLMQENQSLCRVASEVLRGLEPILQKEKPDWVLVQGDTTTVMAASLAAFFQGIKLGHVEAGLRTYDRQQPFPEEINRRIAGVVADLHFAPTRQAADNLTREGIPGSQILITGNPVIDALQQVAALPFRLDSLLPADWSRQSRRIILVTAHRRENFGAGIREICAALQRIAASEDVLIVYPVHLNPNIWEPVHRLLGKVPNILLTPPLDYLPLVHLMKAAYLVLTDSGGIQEEAPGLGVPVLVLREVTERPEAVAAGTVRVVGTNQDRILAEVRRLLEDREAYNRVSRAINPYGDGRAAERIVGALLGQAVEPWQG
jgi:UDP-N-acetylglucosamine 2-epimerase (non-hydrolysing)